MSANVGTADRLIRVVAGLVLLSLLFTLESKLRWLRLAGFPALATGLLAWCPLYTPFGIDTSRVSISAPISSKEAKHTT